MHTKDARKGKRGKQKLTSYILLLLHPGPPWSKQNHFSTVMENVSPLQIVFVVTVTNIPNIGRCPFINGFFELSEIYIRKSRL